MNKINCTLMEISLVWKNLLYKDFMYTSYPVFKVIHLYIASYPPSPFYGYVKGGMLCLTWVIINLAKKNCESCYSKSGRCAGKSIERWCFRYER